MPGCAEVTWLATEDLPVTVTKHESDDGRREVYRHLVIGCPRTAVPLQYAKTQKFLLEPVSLHQKHLTTWLGMWS